MFPVYSHLTPLKNLWVFLCFYFRLLREIRISCSQGKSILVTPMKHTFLLVVIGWCCSLPLHWVDQGKSTSVREMKNTFLLIVIVGSVKIRRDPFLGRRKNDGHRFSKISWGNRTPGGEQAEQVSFPKTIIISTGPILDLRVSSSKAISC